MLRIDPLASLGFVGNDPIFSTMLSPSMTTTQAAIAANFTFVQKIFPAIMVAGGNTVKIRLRGPGTGKTVITAISIGQVAASGNAYNPDGGQVAPLFSSSGSITLNPGDDIMSDNIDFTIDRGSAIVIAFDVSSGSTYAYATGLGSTNYVAYAKSGVSEAATTLKGSGYTSTGSGGGRINMIDLIQVAP